MSDKHTTLETKRARKAKMYAPKFDIRALEAELRKENQYASGINSSYRMDYRRVDYVERMEK